MYKTACISPGHAQVQKPPYTEGCAECGVWACFLIKGRVLLMDGSQHHWYPAFQEPRVGTPLFRWKCCVVSVPFEQHSYHGLKAKRWLWFPLFCFYLLCVARRKRLSLIGAFLVLFQSVPLNVSSSGEWKAFLLMVFSLFQEGWLLNTRWWVLQSGGRGEGWGVALHHRNSR